MRVAGCGLRVAGCAFSLSQPLMACKPVFGSRLGLCARLAEFSKASRLIRSAGRLRKQSMQRRHCALHDPSQNHQAGSEDLRRQGTHTTPTLTPTRNHQKTCQGKAHTQSQPRPLHAAIRRLAKARRAHNPNRQTQNPLKSRRCLSSAQCHPQHTQG